MKKLLILLILIKGNLAMAVNPLKIFCGTWTSYSTAGTYSETWVLDSDNELRGSSSFVKGLDTLEKEKLRIITESNQTLYVAFPSGQLPASFFLSSVNDNTFIFENKEHDFPKQITYHFYDNFRLKITLKGTQKNEPATMEFNLEKKR